MVAGWRGRVGGEVESWRQGTELDREGDAQRLSLLMRAPVGFYQ